MMQEIQETEAERFGNRRRVSKQSFAVLLALARKPLTDRELRTTIGMSPSEFEQQLDRLRRNHLVDMLSEVDGTSVRKAILLTDEGERVLLREMEHMCELPER